MVIYFNEDIDTKMMIYTVYFYYYIIYFCYFVI